MEHLCLDCKDALEESRLDALVDLWNMSECSCRENRPNRWCPVYLLMTLLRRRMWTKDEFLGFESRCSDIRRAVASKQKRPWCLKVDSKCRSGRFYLKMLDDVYELCENSRFYDYETGDDGSATEELEYVAPKSGKIVARRSKVRSTPY